MGSNPFASPSIFGSANPATYGSAGAGTGAGAGGAYSPGNAPNSGGGDFFSSGGGLPTDWLRYFFNTNPQAAIANYRSSTPGLGNTYGQFLNNQTGNIYAGYQSASVQHPNLDFLTYLGQQQGQLQNQFSIDRLRQTHAAGSPRQFLP